MVITLVIIMKLINFRYLPLRILLNVSDSYLSFQLTPAGPLMSPRFLGAALNEVLVPYITKNSFQKLLIFYLPP